MPFLSNGTILQGIDPFKMPYLLFVKSISNLKDFMETCKEPILPLTNLPQRDISFFLCSFFEVTLGYKFNLKCNSHLIIK